VNPQQVNHIDMAPQDAVNKAQRGIAAGRSTLLHAKVCQDEPLKRAVSRDIKRLEAVLSLASAALREDAKVVSIAFDDAMVLLVGPKSVPQPAPLHGTMRTMRDLIPA
jgi:hypothetical protein